MRRFRLLYAALAASIVVATFFVVQAVAQNVVSFPTQSAQAPTVVDIAPVVNTIIQFASAVISLILIPLFWRWWRNKEKEWKLGDLKIEEQFREVIDRGAVAAIGGALERLQIKTGQVTVDMKSRLVADAANQLVKSFPDAFDGLGVKDHLDKAREVIESRLGLTEASAAGSPVIGVNSPPAAVTVPTGEPKKA